MSFEEKWDLEACAREPIHLPGSIQPHGLLLVVDPSSDLVLQSAGHATSLLNYRGSVTGSTLQELIGLSLATLTQRAGSVLVSEPTYLGTAGPFGGNGSLDVTAHLVQNAVVLELLPSNRPASAAEALARIRSATEIIGEASDLIEACHLAADQVRHISGYDRVIIYRFMADASGCVIAETKNHRLPSLLNHRYPASDIPVQARELYCRNAIRIIPDVGYVPAPLEPEQSHLTGATLDMTHCLLRSVSAAHIQYLKNMGVGASMSVSLLPKGELWGLIACHNMTPKLVSYEAQEACRHIGQILSQQVRAREESDAYRIGRELGAARDKVMGALVSSDDPVSILLNSGTDLQAIVPSHGIAVTRATGVAMTGRTPTETQVRQLAAWLQQSISGVSVLATDRLSEDFPAAKAFTSEASGLLAIVLPGDDPVTIMWFRAEQVEEVNSAGNPHKQIDASSPIGMLNPRNSFASWQETVKGHSEPWKTVEIDSVQGFGPRVAFVLQQKTVRELNHLLEQANKKLSALAATDGLTGLANRRAFDERLQMEWKRAHRPPVGALSLMILDLDFFKQYNDHYGHIMGDECLKRVAQILRAERRSSDLAARIGGEEFCLLLPETTASRAMALAEIVRDRIEGLELPHPQSSMGTVTASIGIATAAADGIETARGLMEAADKALYRAKQGGRNRVIYAGAGSVAP